jgi:hypothetical protein
MTAHEAAHEEAKLIEAAVAAAKKLWPPGPWMDEPDRVEFEHAGFPCIIRRVPLGNLCGYVAMPPWHPWHGQHYDNRGLPEAHGGLTYADFCHGTICHEPKWGDPANVWWLGFDCAHYMDLVPEILTLQYRIKDKDFESPFEEIFRKLTEIEKRMPAMHNGTYKGIGYVRAECERIAEHAATLAPGWKTKKRLAKRLRVAQRLAVAGRTRRVL